MYLPNITKTLGGRFGWVTPFIVQNVGAVPTDLHVTFYRFSDGSEVSCRVVEGVGPGKSFAHVPNEDATLPDDAQFSVIVRSYGAPVVAVVNEHQGEGTRAEALSYRGLDAGALRVGIPYFTRTAAGWLTTAIMQNVGSSQATVRAAFVSHDGARSAVLTRQIGPGRSAFINPSVQAEFVDGVEYAGLVTSDQPIAVVVNAHNDAPGTIAPRGYSYNGVPSGPSANVFVPYVTRNAGAFVPSSTTRLLIQNVGTSMAMPNLWTLQLGMSYGGSAYSAPRPLAPGAVWAVDPRYKFDGTPCVNGQVDCLANGEHSVVVSGGTFAVLAVIDSGVVALGMTGLSQASTKVFLPNVTRRLGGADGWTTPIIVQSATAREFTLSWSRFADGQLVTQQDYTLTPWSARRIDPRTVAGLVDGTQYAVTVEARGGDLVAIVSEHHFAGGDGGMVYEGLPAPTTAPLAAPTPVGQRSLVDRPDEVDGYQVHAIYVTARDGADERLDTSGSIARSIEQFQTWLRTQTGGRVLPLDTYEGQLDITFFRSGKTDAEIRSANAFIRDRLEEELIAANLIRANKLYAVYYGGSSNFSCGGGAWPPDLPGLVGAVYLRGEPPGAPPCSVNTLAPSSGPQYLEFAMLHELMHTMGFDAPCSKQHTLRGHVSDTPRDLMWAGNASWQLPPVLDQGQDDYYGHSRQGCLDLSWSGWLVPAR